MKGCFYLQRRFAHIGHVMAVLLQERHHITDFCGYVLDRSSLAFLTNQKDIAYSRLVLEDDIVARYKTEHIDPEYLAYLEKEFGIPNLWPHIIPDRIIRYNLYLRAYPSDVSQYSHEDMIKMVQVTARAIIDFFDTERPNFIFFSVVGNLSSMLLYHIAKKKGIRTILLDSPRIGIQYFLSERYDRSTFLEKTLEQMHALPPQDPRYVKAERFLVDFRKRPRYFLEASVGADAIMKHFKKSGLKYFSFLLPREFLRSLRWTTSAFIQYFKNPRTDDYIVVKPWHELADKIKRRMRILRGYHNLYDVSPAGESFAYFALHTEPEAYPAVLAPFYVDQVWLAKQIARSLPMHMKLYVKDHPIMLGLRPRSYYKELKKLPNVRLIDPGVSSLELIEKSELVLTISGTSGWEGILLKKPVIVFGPMYYSNLSRVRFCPDITQLPYVVKEQLESYQHNESELIRFIAACSEESVELELVQMWDIEGGSAPEKNKDRLVALVDLLAKKLM